MIKQNWTYFLFTLAIAVFIYTFFIQSNSAITYEVYGTGNKWSYKILQHDTVFIQQEQIPAVEGYKYFQTKNEAVNTARLVIQKMKKNELPIITVAEIDSMGIAY